MNIEDLRNICIALPLVTEEFPFDNDTLVFKVAGKMFALTSLRDSSTVNLKCEPEIALELRERYKGVNPGYHMNKKHWNTIMMDGDYSNSLLKEWIIKSYNLVYNKLPKKLKTTK
jgi:predicted DNA-binding protein (MmcQ/YjbR family)